MDMIRLQIKILCFLAIGWIMGRKKWISQSTAKQMNFLVANLILPCSIFISFLIEPTDEIIQSTLTIFVLSFGIQVLMLFVSPLLWKHIRDPKHRINLEYATVSNNAGTLGTIISQAAFGQIGVLYASIYAIWLRIVMWAYGITIYQSNKQMDLKALVKKVVFHPCMIAIEVGVLCMVAQYFGFQFPTLLEETLSDLGKCNTVFIMLIIGVILSQIDIRDVFQKDVLLYCLFRLVLIPIAIGCLLALIGINGLPLGICVLESAMPAPVTMAILSQKYDVDERFASELIFLSTVLSMITLPLWTIVLTSL